MNLYISKDLIWVIIMRNRQSETKVLEKNTLNGTLDEIELENQKIVTNATKKAANILSISDIQLKAILEIHDTNAKINSQSIKYDSVQYFNALYFIRVYRSLYSIVGNDKTAKEWLRCNNTALGNIPLEMIQTHDGLLNVVAYLDAFRAKV